MVSPLNQEKLSCLPLHTGQTSATLETSQVLPPAGHTVNNLNQAMPNSALASTHPSQPMPAPSAVFLPASELQGVSNYTARMYDKPNIKGFAPFRMNDPEGSLAILRLEFQVRNIVDHRHMLQVLALLVGPRLWSRYLRTNPTTMPTFDGFCSYLRTNLTTSYSYLQSRPVSSLEEWENRRSLGKLEKDFVYS